MVNRLYKKIIIPIVMLCIFVIFGSVSSLENEKRITIDDYIKSKYGKIKQTGANSINYVHYDYGDAYPRAMIENVTLKSYVKKKNIFSLSSRAKSYEWLLKYNCTITSSSVYEKNANDYLPENIADNRLDTAWVEGVKGYGYKEWINVKYEVTTNDEVGFGLDELLISPGFAKTKRLFKYNNRVKTLILICTNHSKKTVVETGVTYLANIRTWRLHFKDENKIHVFRISSPYLIINDGILEYDFIIESVYKGSKYDDTCISEIVLAR